MKQGWTYKKLGECTEILDSQRKPVTKKDRTGGIYPYYGATGIQDYVDKYIFDGRYVLVGEDGAKWSAFDKSAYIIEGKTWVNNHAHVLKPYIELYDSFLMYYLNFSDLDRFISGAIVRKLTQAALRNIDIPLPPLSVQHSIVSELDKINELIRLKKEQLKDYDNLAQSIFYEMFGDPVENEKGWEVKKLGEEYKVSSSKRIMQDEWTTEGVPFLKVSDVVSKINGQNSEPSTFISETTYSKLVDSNAVPVQNDILITSRGTLGLCYIVKNEDRFYFQDGMITWLAECKGNIMPIFLTYLFKNHQFLQQITSKANKSTVAYISISQISKREIPLPPLFLQQLFAKRIELIEKQKAEIQSTIAALETLLASRMQYWFD